MKLFIKNGTEELLSTLKENGYEVKEVDQLEKEIVEVEKVVQVEKELPEYLKTIDEVIKGRVAIETEEAKKELVTYKAKLDKIVSLFNDDKVEEEEVKE